MNISIDEKLVAKAMKISGAKSETEMVEKAIREMLTRRNSGKETKRKGLFELAGKIDFYEGFDPIELRKDRDFSD